MRIEGFFARNSLTGSHAEGQRQVMYKHFFKRFIDILLSGLAIIILALPMLIVAIIVKIDSPGPVLFKQKRIGRGKKPFTILKFRSMPVSAPHDTPTHELKNSENMLSRWQKFIRASSVDELPQLLNIFVGQMSIIGPRPALWNQYDLIEERDKYGANDVRPGLTGWAQINGRDELEIADKARLDGEYVEKLSFGFDCKCFFGTIGKVLHRDGVVEGGTGEIHARENASDSSADAMPEVAATAEIQSLERVDPAAETAVAANEQIGNGNGSAIPESDEIGVTEQRKHGKKIMLICVSSQNVLTFRKELIRALQNEGCEVSVVCFDDLYRDKIEPLGVEFISVGDSNRSTNPLKVLALKKKYRAIVEKIKPDVVFAFAMKPNALGVPAAKKAGAAEIYSMVEGAGDVFINNSFKWKLIRVYVSHLYKKAFKISRKVVFLNEDDKKEFIARKLVKPNKCEIINGIGVDVNKFAFRPMQNGANFLMVARMLKTKGVMEYCEAARMVKAVRPQAVFGYVGGEGTITLGDIKSYIDDGSVTYFGTTDDVRPYYEACTAFVLPSYREGMPMAVMEAESVGRAIIATDVNGCRSAVRDDYNGFLIAKGDSCAAELANKCIYFIDNPEVAAEMGEKSRTLAENEFDSRVINAKLLRIIGITEDKDSE